MISKEAICSSLLYTEPFRLRHTRICAQQKRNVFCVQKREIFSNALICESEYRSLRQYEKN